MSIRRLTIDDIDKIISLEKQLREDEPDTYFDLNEDFLRENYKTIDDDNQNITFILEDNDEIIGRVDLILMKSHFDFESVGYVDWIFVRKPYRGKGLAKQLLKKAQEWFIENDVSFYYLFVARNEQAKAFYDSVDMKQKDITRAVKYLK